MVCVVGMDVLEFLRVYVFEVLVFVEGVLSVDVSRVAFGSSRDGGFYCVVARVTRVNCDVFECVFVGVCWSVLMMFEECVCNCCVNGFDVCVMMLELLDVDDDGDLDVFFVERFVVDDECEFLVVCDVFVEMV